MFLKIHVKRTGVAVLIFGGKTEIPRHWLFIVSAYRQRATRREYYIGVDGVKPPISVQWQINNVVKAATLSICAGGHTIVIIHAYVQ